MSHITWKTAIDYPGEREALCEAISSLCDNRPAVVILDVLTALLVHVSFDMDQDSGTLIRNVQGMLDQFLENEDDTS